MLDSGYLTVQLKRGRLTKAQEAVFRHTWEGKTYLEMAREVTYDPGHIKDVGSQLWRSLSQALGEKVTKNNLHGVLKRAAHHHNGTNTSQVFTPHIDWGEAIDVSRFYGRTTELETLSKWIVGDSPKGDSYASRCRLITLLGMGGIGKTTLAVKVAEDNQHTFEYIFWLLPHISIRELIESLESLKASFYRNFWQYFGSGI